MSLSSNSSETSFISDSPCDKLSFNINAFNGNTTNFNNCPSSKSHPLPVQPRNKPTFGSFGGGSMTVGLVRPM